MKKLFPTFLLIAYTVLLIKVLVFKEVPMIRTGLVRLKFGGTNAENPANFVPFKTILPYLLGENGFIIGGLNLVGNIALLVPIGFLVPLIFQSMTWKKSLILAVAAGLTIEIMQVILQVGIFDIDDVILNGFGVMIGYWTFAILAKLVRLKMYKTMISITIIGIIIVAAVFYGIVTDIKSQPKINPRIGAKVVQRTVGTDLCGGTGGTGQIVNKGNNTISIKRNDGVLQTIKLTSETEINLPRD